MAKLEISADAIKRVKEMAEFEFPPGDGYFFFAGNPRQHHLPPLNPAFSKTVVKKASDPILEWCKKWLKRNEPGKN